MDELLTLKNVTKIIKGKTIINDLSFSVTKGEVFGFLGPNGAGKTTTIRMIVGLMEISKGDIVVCGKSIKQDFEAAVRNIGAIVENPEMYKYLSGYQNLMQYARMHKGITKEKVDEVIQLVGLTKRIHDKVRTYSLGMRQRLGLAQCLLHDPKLLILDEPTNGLDPAGIREIRDHLKVLTREKGMSVIVSSHLLSEMEMMCDRIAIIQNGKLTTIQSIHNEQEQAEQQLFEFETGELGSTKAWLTNDMNAIITEKGFTLHADKEQIPLLLKQLIKDDINVYSVKPISKSLEDRFLELTEQGGKNVG
ncbi:ABC-2 type transport system ATP-binding protein [Metabacillus malikii]|uniref:ABC-2 type transport system ATP-binding protein n=1 Tax=Metabacillus malikii TaxID=1504265 RepID=A0ABT9ZHE8_9BACI|nr:ABC transporter ATP-binding protein [Metabacillus malikii]MDQ0231714.1 ABC-2 type transport system ATP-binding protein [Metabacillus malikii]